MTERGPDHPAPGDRAADDERGARTVPTGNGVTAVIGELDMDSTPRVVAALEQAATHDVDLSRVTFIDVAGLRALRKVPGLRVVRSCPVVERLLRLCGLDPTRRAPSAPPGNASC